MINGSASLALSIRIGGKHAPDSFKYRSRSAYDIELSMSENQTHWLHVEQLALLSWVSQTIEPFAQRDKRLNVVWSSYTSAPILSFYTVCIV